MAPDQSSEGRPKGNRPDRRILYDFMPVILEWNRNTSETTENLLLSLVDSLLF